jgi:hypothetical protein
LRPIFQLLAGRVSLMHRWIPIVGVGLLASCPAPTASAPTIDVVFAVESDLGQPLQQVHVSVDGQSLGETDSNGLARASVDGNPGKRFRVEHDCPKGHVAPSEPKFLRLRSFSRVGESHSRKLKITLRCKPEMRLAVFIIRAKNGAGLPVLLNGQSVARTNPSGVAQFSASAPPDTDFVIEFDTASRSQLSPQRPTHLRTLPDADEIFVINQSFDLRKPPRRRGRQRTRITKIE